MKRGNKMENNKTIKNLSAVEWKIYNYLKERTLEEKWTKQKEIIEYLETKDIKINERNLRLHIQNIRKCEIIKKVILTAYSKGYKIMSEKDEFDILLNRKISLLKSLKQFYRDKKRLSLNNQMKLNFDTKEREFIESLLK